MAVWDYMGHEARREAIVNGLERGASVAELCDLYGLDQRIVRQYMPAVAAEAKPESPPPPPAPIHFDPPTVPVSDGFSVDADELVAAEEDAAAEAPNPVVRRGRPPGTKNGTGWKPGSSHAPVDDFVEAIERHRSCVQQPVSLVAAIKHLGCKTVMVSALDGAMLWKRLRLELKEPLTLNMYREGLVGFECHGIRVIWYGRAMGVDDTEVV